MTFKISKRYEDKKKKEYNLKYIMIGDIQVHVYDLKDRSVSPEDYRQMRMNSYAQDEIPSKLTDSALIEKAKYYLTQATPQRNFPCTTYDESLLYSILPEMIKRLEEKQ